MSVKEALQGILKPDAAPTPKAPVSTKRTLGDIHVALEAQRVYNPSMPSVPKPPAMNNPQAQGTAPKLGTEGRWGNPEKK
jgi:hypothetical protein